MRLNVFISWSKPRSYRVAVVLKGWLRAFFQGVVPRMSDDVEGGGPILPRLNAMLRNADILLLCITSENWKGPWIFYEVGMAFGKSEENAKVFPYIIDLHLKRGKLPEPLKQFKAFMANEDDTYELVCEINKALGYPLSELELRASFDSKWPDLKKVIEEVQPTTNQPDPRLCVKDWRMVSECIESHQDRLECRLRDCIDVAIKAVQSDSYDREKLIDLAWREIEESKERCRDRNSILVGNVADFFSANYNKDDLRRVVESMESDLLPGRDPDTVAARLVARMQRALQEVFKRFHRTLLERLKECLGEGED